MKPTLPKSKPGAQALTVLPPESSALSADFAHARLLITAARGSMMQAAGFMVLFGLEAKRLKKTYGVQRGGDRKSDQTRSGSGLISWADLCQQELGVTDDTVAKYIAMAEGAKKRCKVLQELESQLIEMPLMALPEADRVRVEKAVHKITDGNTAKGLMQEWGIARKDAGITESNRNKGGNSTKSKTTPEEAAQEHFITLWQLLNGLRHDVTPDQFEKHLAHLPVDLEPDQHPMHIVTLVHLADELEAWHERVEAMRKNVIRALHAEGAARHQATKAPRHRTGADADA